MSKLIPRVESLKIGDLVMTADGVAKKVKWIGTRAYTAATVAANRHAQPVIIRKDAVAQGMPHRDLQLSANHAVFIDDSVPTPDQDAGSNAAFQHIKSLMRLGYKVTFIPADNMARISPYTEALQALGVECIYYPFYWSVEEYFRKNPAPIDLVYLHRFNNGTKYAGMVRRHQPKARILYNVADLHYLRMEREAELTGDADLARRAAAIRHESKELDSASAEARSAIADTTRPHRGMRRPRQASATNVPHANTASPKM